MVNSIDETGAKYISQLSIGGQKYTIKDAWLREEVSAVKAVVAGGVQFKGITTTALADGEALKELSVAGSTLAVADQKDGYLFIYNDGKQNLEFVVSNGIYSELGSTGKLGLLAFSDSAKGQVTIPLRENIQFESYLPDVDMGTVALRPSDTTLSVTHSDDTAKGTFTPANIEVSEKEVTMTPATSTFTALTSASYDEATGTLTIGEATSPTFLTGVTGKVAGYTLEQTENQSISVTYKKANEWSQHVLTGVDLEGNLHVGAKAPTAIITDPTVTVRVTPETSNPEIVEAYSSGMQSDPEHLYVGNNWDYVMTGAKLANASVAIATTKEDGSELRVEVPADKITATENQIIINGTWLTSAMLDVSSDETPVVFEITTPLGSSTYATITGIA